MAWDTHHKNLAMKAVATVETNMKYDVIYTGDAITIGVIQWYAGRACELLTAMKNIPEYQQLPQRLRDFHAKYPDHNAHWNQWTGFWVRHDELDPIKRVMSSANAKKIQNAEAKKELQSYYQPFKALGFDPEKQTKNFCFFCVAYHQGPAFTRKVWRQAGSDPSLDRLFSLVMQHSWFRKFRNRYTIAKKIIESNDPSGLPPGLAVGDGSDPETSEPGETPQGEANNGELDDDVTKFSHATIVGDDIHVTGEFGTVIFRGTGGNWFTPINRATNEEVSDEDTSNPSSSANSPEAGAKLVKWMKDRIGKFKYLQGPGRLDPDRSGVTDCSAIVRRAYIDVVGITLGTSTHSQYNQGKIVHEGGRGEKIPLNKLQLGDLIYFDWASDGQTYHYGHVEMYAGDGQTIGHGGRPYMGPVLKSLDSQTRIALRTRVNRHI